MTPQTMRERSWSERDQKASVKPKTCRKNNKSCQPLNICQMTFIYYYIYHRYHHRINLYIIRSFCKKTHESAFGFRPSLLIHTFQNKKIHGFCPRFWGGASSSESDSDSGSSDSEEATPATREWVLKVTKMGQRYDICVFCW